MQEKKNIQAQACTHRKKKASSFQHHRRRCSTLAPSIKERTKKTETWSVSHCCKLRLLLNTFFGTQKHAQFFIFYFFGFKLLKVFIV